MRFIQTFQLYDFFDTLGSLLVAFVFGTLIALLLILRISMQWNVAGSHPCHVDRQHLGLAKNLLGIRGLISANDPNATSLGSFRQPLRIRSAGPIAFLRTLVPLPTFGSLPTLPFC